MQATHFFEQRCTQDDISFEVPASRRRRIVADRDAVNEGGKKLILKWKFYINTSILSAKCHRLFGE